MASVFSLESLRWKREGGTRFSIVRGSNLVGLKNHPSFPDWQDVYSGPISSRPVHPDPNEWYIYGEPDPDNPPSLYNPLEESPPLFLLFTQAKPRGKYCVEFAQRFGWLLDEDSIYHSPCALWSTSEAIPDDPIGFAEPYGIWVEKWWLFSIAQDLWTAMRFGDIPRIKAASAGISTDQERDLLMDNGIADDPKLDVARSILLRIVNSLMQTNVAYLPTLTSEGSGFDLSLRPNNLLAVMAAQLSTAIAGDHELRQCSQCGCWFTVRPPDTRSTRYFCSNKCRTKSHRERQKKALELQSKGKTLHEIASELEVDLETATFWATKTRSKRTRKSVLGGD
ncbi:MAG: hypothetical protein WCL39_06550 [Armatimonadota bacterium]